MSNRIVFGLAGAGILAGAVAAYVFGIERKVQPPVFQPVTSPYASAIYANGIIESDQLSGSNISIYPEVTGRVTKVLVREGQAVKAGDPLLAIDDSVQRAATEQLRLQADAARTALQELKAQPRPETLAVAAAQVTQAEAAVREARNQYDKRAASYRIDPHSISKDTLDTAEDTLRSAESALGVARRQYELTHAGAWSYDIVNQDRQYQALRQSYLSADALLSKFVVRAQEAGVVLAVNAALGASVSPQGAYDTYTQAFDPVAVLARGQRQLAVRVYIDEILISRLPDPAHVKAEMSMRGSDVKVPLEFERVQPYVTPKIELSDQRQERVDLRVLPVIFRFDNPDPRTIYPGQLVDVYIGRK